MLRPIELPTDCQTIAPTYGWTDLGRPRRVFRKTTKGVHFTVSEHFRRDLLHRLLKLNQERKAEEVARGMHSKGKAKDVKSEDRKPPSKSKSATPMLVNFEEAE